MTKNILLLLLLALVTQACYKDNNQATEKVITEYPETEVVTSTLAGTVLYPDGSTPAVEGFRFNNQTSTISHPYFYFDANYINQNFEVLHIDLESGHKLYYPLNNLANNCNKHTLTIPKLENTVAESGGLFSMSLESGLTFSIPSNAFYQGSTNVSSPEIYFEEIIDHTIPGSSQGFSNYKEPILLSESEIFYMGWKASEVTLEMNTNLDASTALTLYYLDPSTGKWNEQPLTGTFSAGFYAFSNELLAEAIELVINHHIPSQRLSIITVVDDEILSRQTLGINSRLPIYVPREQDFELVVELENKELLVSSQFITSPQDIELTVEYNTYETIDIVLSSRNCEAQNDPDNILEITGDKYYEFFFLSEDKLTILRPASDLLTCKVFKRDETVSTTAITYENSSEIYLGKQFLCPDVGDEYLYFFTEGNARILTEVSSSYEESTITIDALNKDNDINLQLVFKTDQEGKIDDKDINVVFEAPNLATGFKINCGQSTEGCGFTDFDVKLFLSEDNPYVKGIFSGEFWMESLSDNSVGYRKMSGEFQIKIL